MSVVDIDLIRKTASLESGRRVLENYGRVAIDPVVELRLQKAASAQDKELLKIAAWCGEGDTLELYEILGGEFTP